MELGSEEPIRPGLPQVDPQDVDQECELLRLMGKTPKRSLVALRLQEREYVLGLMNGGESEGSLDGRVTEIWTRIYSPAAVEELVSWALEQVEEVQEAIFGFLDDELSFQDVLRILDAADLLRVKSQRSPATVTELILRSLPATKEQLAELVRQSHTTRRPEATLRQILRRLSKEGRITIRGEYYVSL